MSNDVPIKGYPNVAKRFGVGEYNIDADGNFMDRLGYVAAQLMGHCFVNLANLQRIHTPETPILNLEAFLRQSAEGELMGLKDSSGPAFRSNAGALNAFYPEIRDLAVPKMLALPDTDGDSLGKQFQRGGPL